MNTNIRNLIIAVVVLGVAPYLLYPVFLAKLLCFALFAAAFNLLLGYAGILSFGHAAFLVFYFGVGLVGFIGAILANGFFGFAETSVKNRELRRQNQEILEHNQALERKLDQIIQRLEG